MSCASSDTTVVGEPSFEAKCLPEADVEAKLTNEASPGAVNLSQGKREHPENEKLDVIWVEFEEGEDPRKHGDAGDPFLWPKRRKWTLTLLLCLFGLFAPWAGAGFAIGVEQMQEDLGVSTELAQLAESLYPLGFGLGPLFLAPISEEVGRSPVYLVTLFLAVILCLPVGLSNNITGVCICRLLGGMASSTGSTLIGGSLADMWQTHERGLPMSLFSFVSFAGIALAPMSMGYVVQNISPAGWRWIQYIQLAWGGLAFVLICFNLRESRGSVLLRRRAKRLRQQTGDQRYRARSEDGPSFAQVMRLSLLRPCIFLVTEPVVLFTSLWIGWIWSMIWADLAAVPVTYSQVYGWNIGAQGLAFTGLLIGVTIGALVNYFAQERLYARYSSKYGPEARLLTAIPGGFLLPIGTFIFAAAQGRGHWIGPQFGLAMLMCGCYIIFLAVFSYVADSYVVYASSALAGQSLLRNLCGFVFPLFIKQMLSALGITWTCVIFGFIGLILAAIPIVFFIFGKRIRARSRVAVELARLQEQRKA